MCSVNRESIDEYLNEVSKEIQKNFKSQSVDITIVGDAASLLNYGFANAVSKIDVMSTECIELNSVNRAVVAKCNLRHDLISNDFMDSRAYVPILTEVCEYYRSFNGVLNVYTIKGIYLLIIKMITYKEGTRDKCDVINLVSTLPSNATMRVIYDTCTMLYGNVDILNKKAVQVVESVLCKTEYDICTKCGSTTLSISTGTVCLNCGQ